MAEVVLTNGPDIDAVLARLGGLMLTPPAPADTRAFVHEGSPISKGRPRFSAKHNRCFTPKRTVDAERDLVWLDVVWPMFRKSEWRTVGRITVIRSTNHRARIATIFERVA